MIATRVPDERVHTAIDRHPIPDDSPATARGLGDLLCQSDDELVIGEVLKVTAHDRRVGIHIEHPADERGIADADRMPSVGAADQIEEQSHAPLDDLEAGRLAEVGQDGVHGVVGLAFVGRLAAKRRGRRRALGRFGIPDEALDPMGRYIALGGAATPRLTSRHGNARAAEEGRCGQGGHERLKMVVVIN